MALLKEFLWAETAILVAGIGAAALWKALRPRPGLRWLLGTRDRDGRLAPGLLRLQMCFVSLAVALWYLARSLRAAGSAAMPTIPWPVLVVLALSHAAWLGGEVRRLRAPRFEN